MILLHICGQDQDQIEEIARVLLSENLIMDVNLNVASQRFELSGETFKRSSWVQLTGKTKSLLFSTIDDRITELFPDNLPEIYSLPIVDMDWDQASKLSLEMPITERMYQVLYCNARVDRAITEILGATSKHELAGRRWRLFSFLGKRARGKMS